MDEQEREYLLENARRMELLEETPTAPSGRCSDMTEVEKEKLIDLLYSLNDQLKVQMAGLQEELRLQREQSAEQHNRLTSQLDRMEERAIAAERRADTSDKRADEAEKRVAELTAALTAALDGTVIKNLESKIAETEKERDDARSADKQNRSERYGSTSQKLRKTSEEKKKSEDEDNNRDAGEEKSDMGGSDSVNPLPEVDSHGDDFVDSWLHDTYETARPNRQGQSNNTMVAER